MPFEPRLFSDSSGDASIPAPRGDDSTIARFAETDGWPPLAAVLAEQLHSDAQRLESAYPPPQSTGLAAMLQARLQAVCDVVAAGDQVGSASDSISVELEPSRLAYPQTLAPRVAWRQIAAAVTLILPTLALLSWRINQPAPLIVQQPAAPLNAGKAITSALAIAEQPPQPTSLYPASAHESLPPHLFKSLSGPQQEAILDMLEEQDMAPGSLSI